MTSTPEGDRPRSTGGSQATSSVDDRSAVVLAGGRSTRFGDDDKALADVAGVPMLGRTAGRLATVVGTVVVSCREDQRPAFEALLSDVPAETRFALDPVEDPGPLAGLHAGLDVVPDGRAVVVACDMPLVQPDVVERLFDCQVGGEVAVILDDGHLQPAHAVYPVAHTRSACERALAAGRRDLMAILERLPATTLSADDVDGVARSVTNVNTRDQLRRAEDRL